MDINEKLSAIIQELRECREDLAADNDRAELEADEREKLEWALRVNERVWRNAPRVVRDYVNDVVMVYSGDKRIF